MVVGEVHGVQVGREMRLGDSDSLSMSFETKHLTGLNW